MKTIELSFRDWISFSQWLDIPLHGNEIRVRDRFIQILKPSLDTIDPQRTAILSKFANKGEDGKAIIKDGMYEIPAEKKEECFKEVDETLNKTVKIELDKSDFPVIRDLLLNKVAKGMRTDEGVVYNKICSLIESL